MSITITSGFGGTFVFQNYTSLAPSLVTENLSRFWDLARPAQVDTLASAYQHLSGLRDSNPEVLASVGQMSQRLNEDAESSPVDHLVLGRLLLEWGRLKSVFPPSSPPSPPRSDHPASSPTPGAEPRVKTPVPPSNNPARRVPRGMDGTRSTGQFYLEKGGLFPPSWRSLSDDMKSALKSLNFARKGKMSNLTLDDGMHAQFLIEAVAGWIGGIADAAVKGTGKSGTASAPSIQASLNLISEMTAFLGDTRRLESPLSLIFWRSLGEHQTIQMGINRLLMRNALSTLEGNQREALERALYALNGAFLASVLLHLPNPDNGASDPGRRDEATGELLAQNLGDSIAGMILSERVPLKPSEQVQLTTAGSILRIIAQEVRADAASPVVRGFLKRLSYADTLRLASLVDLIVAK